MPNETVIMSLFDECLRVEQKTESRSKYSCRSNTFSSKATATDEVFRSFPSKNINSTQEKQSTSHETLIAVKLCQYYQQDILNISNIKEFIM